MVLIGTSCAAALGGDDLLLAYANRLQGVRHELKASLAKLEGLTPSQRAEAIDGIAQVKVVKELAPEIAAQAVAVTIAFSNLDDEDQDAVQFYDSVYSGTLRMLVARGDSVARRELLKVARQLRLDARNLEVLNQALQEVGAAGQPQPPTNASSVTGTEGNIGPKK